ncbi:MAG: hypothetical protein LWW85_05230, partial [Marinilabiliales bacterium]|nr:hypothetical protein [Marinilabiliales bacterium]
MDTGKQVSRLSKIARDLNVGINTIVEFLNKQGFKISADPNAKIDVDAQVLLEKQFRKDHDAKLEADAHRPGRVKRDTITIETIHQPDSKSAVEEDEDDSVTIKDNTLQSRMSRSHETVQKPVAPEVTRSAAPEKPGVKVVGSIDLNAGKTKSPEPATPAKEAKPAAQEQPKEAEKPAAAKPVVPSPVSEASAEKKEEPVPQEKSESGPEMISNVPQIEATLNIVGKIDLDAPRSSEGGKKEVTLTKKKQLPVKGAEGKPAKPRDGKHRDEALEEIFPDMAEVPEEIFKHAREILSGPKVVGKIELPQEGKKGVGVREEDRSLRKKKRKRVSKDAKERVPLNIDKKPEDPKDKDKKEGVKSTLKKKSSLVVKKKVPLKKEVNEEDVQKQVKETLARLTTKSQKTRGSKHRRDKRLAFSEKMAEESAQADIDRNIIKVTEFVSVSELASMMDVNPTQVIATCMSLGLFVSI